MFTKTFTAASSDIADYHKIEGLPASIDGASQFARVMARGNHASGSATIQRVLVRNGTVLFAENGTVTISASARRSDADNGGGDYLCDVVWPQSGNDQFDLLGSEGSANPDAYNANHAVWMIGCTAITNFTSLTLEIATSNDSE